MDPVVYKIKLPPTGSIIYPDILRDGTPFASIGAENVKNPNPTSYWHQAEFLYQGVKHASVSNDSVWYLHSSTHSSAFNIPMWFGPEERGEPDADWLVARKWHIRCGDSTEYHWRTMRGDLSKRELYQGNERLAECINHSGSKSVELKCYDPNLESSSLLYPCLIYAFLVCSGRVDNINGAEIPPVPKPAADTKDAPNGLQTTQPSSTRADTKEGS